MVFNEYCYLILASRGKKDLANFYPSFDDFFQNSGNLQLGSSVSSVENQYQQHTCSAHQPKVRVRQSGAVQVQGASVCVISHSSGWFSSSLRIMIMNQFAPHSWFIHCYFAHWKTKLNSNKQRCQIFLFKAPTTKVEELISINHHITKFCPQQGIRSLRSKTKQVIKKKIKPLQGHTCSQSLCKWHLHQGFCNGTAETWSFLLVWPRWGGKKKLF